jgi:organic radical activating enzyme
MMEQVEKGRVLPVMERFLTIQGEGAHVGTSAWFIRLAGCDVGCAWCDVKESWDAARWPQVSVEALVSEARASGAPICVVTGGEPAMHVLEPLTAGLQAAGLRTHIETSGAHPITGQWDWITLSPKRFKPAREEVFAQAHELKVVVVNSADLGWAEEHAARLQPEAVCFLQPEWDRRERVLGRILTHIAGHPRWRLSLQTHKYIGVR